MARHQLIQDLVARGYDDPRYPLARCAGRYGVNTDEMSTYDLAVFLTDRNWTVDDIGQALS